MTSIFFCSMCNKTIIRFRICDNLSRIIKVFVRVISPYLGLDFSAYHRNLILLQAVLLVYDVTNQNSFDNLEDWYDTVKKLCEKDGYRLPHVALVANKSKFQTLDTV